MASKSSPSKLDIPHPIPEERRPTHWAPTMVTSVATSEPDIDSTFKLIHAEARHRETMKVSKPVNVKSILTGMVCCVLWALVEGFSEYSWNKEQGSRWSVRSGIIFSGIIATTPFFVTRLNRDEKNKEEWEVLRDSTGEDKIVLVAKLEDEIVGALVLCDCSSHDCKDLVCVLEEDKDRKRVFHIAEGQKVGLIRAWAVEHHHRGKGIGSELLREALTVCQQKNWAGPVFDGKDVDSQVLEKMIREEQGWA